MRFRNIFFNLSVLLALLLSLAGSAFYISPAQASVSNNGLWTWVDGTSTPNGGGWGTYGTEDVPDAANVPGARSRAVSWIDKDGNLWLFGGLGAAKSGSGSEGDLNDLWRFNPRTGEWTWVDGSNIADQTGVYGTEDVPAASNVPGARESAVSWIDGDGKLWLFGGVYNDGSALHYFNDLWRFDPKTEEWTWVDGSNTMDQSGVYGTEDVPNVNNVPGARGHAISWIDENNNLWLFGGGTGTYTGVLNDLWRFNPSTEEWTWVDGSNIADQPGVYGTEDVPAASNVPGARGSAASWIDVSGNLWLFGGNGKNNTIHGGDLQDLWKFNPGTQQWTWVDGSTYTNQFGTYGTRGTPASANIPGGRGAAVSWIDENDNLWLFGGQGYSSSDYGQLNDLWKFDQGSGEWTWVDGSTTKNQTGTYGTEDVQGAANVPGARRDAVSWIDENDNLWLFGGDGYDSQTGITRLNGLWKFSKRILYVDPNPVLSAGCSSWADACDLQTALTTAIPDDEIWVKQGIHYPTTGQDRTISFALVNGVEIYGGFNGTETLRYQRDWEANLTTLSGDIGTSGVSSDNSYHVVAADFGVSNSTLLDGFTISGGYAAATAPTDSGGGMLSIFASPTLRNLIFENNYANNNGGGMANSSSSSTLTNVIFKGNQASGDGGGMYNEGSSPLLVNVVFSGNAGDVGGGMTNAQNSNPTLTNITFNGNHAQSSGGMHNDANSSPLIQNSIFWGNLDDQGSTAGISTSGTATIRYSLVQGCNPGSSWNSSCGTDGGNNLADIDPLFVTSVDPNAVPTASGNLRIKLNSPALNVGNNNADLDGAGSGTATISDIDVDVAGQVRIIRTTVDLGAYENQILSADDFVITVKTDNSGVSTNTQFTIPTALGSSYNYNVDCDADGTNEATAQTGSYTCDYGAGNEGAYTVVIKDNSGAGTGFPRIYFGDSSGTDNEKLLSIDQWGTGKWTSMYGAFDGCTNLTGQASDTPDLSNTTDLSGMFRSSSFNQDVGNWDTGNITLMAGMFKLASSFDQDISGWDVTSLSDATNMFDGVTLSSANYDALLNSWNAQTLQSNVTFDGGNSKYCNGETARTNMINTQGWMITDGGKDCSQSNDFIEHAVDIQALGQTGMNTSSATSSLSDPDLTTHSCGITGKGKATVWYKYALTAHNAISVDTIGSGYDTFIAIWEGTDINNLRFVACNDDTGGTKQSAVAIRVSGGHTYYIEIGQP